MRNSARHSFAAFALASAVVLAPTLTWSDDSDLFSTTAVAPNVLLLMDNSSTMNTIIYHPSFVPGAASTCDSATYGSFPATADGAFDPSAIYYAENNKFYTYDGVTLTNQGSTTRTHCGKTRTIYTDSKADTDPDLNKRYTRWPGDYLNWYFSAAADAAYVQISQNNNGFPSSCVGGVSFARYQRTRLNVAKQVLKDVVCEVNLVGQVRFGVATYRDSGAGTDDPNGGYVIEEVDIPNSAQQADLVSAIQSLAAETASPTAEALFQLYTYFMSRASADLPKGADGSTKFPAYTYDTGSSGVGGNYDTGTNQAADPVQYSCQKNFVMIISDGDPTKDDFDTENPANTAYGFNQFMSLIGDYNADGETETGAGVICPPNTGACEPSRWLDDIAKYMHENDMRPDFNGDQTLDIYTIGFNASSASNAQLTKTASVGNGLHFGVSDESALAQAIIDSLQDIIEKSQSFTAATVPASRTLAGEQIYVSLFTPTSRSPYWNGSLRSYKFTADGQVLSSNGSCALDDPSGNCHDGGFLPTATHPPYWDAADEIPAPASRNLWTSLWDTSGAGSTDVVRFRHESVAGGTLDDLDLGVVFPPPAPYTGSVATNEDQLTAEIIANVRGCYMGTGANGVPCQVRPSVLSDIFHSNPVVVGAPSYSSSDPSFSAFRANYLTRDRVIYAGSNGGFMHGFHAGDWITTPAPAHYDEGTGTELFGFMPWPTRQIIKNVPRDTGGRDYYGVDGSPLTADAWIHTTAGQTTKLASGSEWRTVLVGGLRQGGESYFALDITDPGATSCPSGEVGSQYPCLMWEFPKEVDTAAIKATIGETWGEVIVTKVKLSVSGNVVERSVAIVTGGYHASGDPNDHASYNAAGTKGRSIWILDLKTGRPIAKRSQSVLNTCGSAPALQGNDETGMCYAIASSPAVFDTDDDGFADVIVVGDLGGNVWKWVIKDVAWDPVNDALHTTADNNLIWKFRKIFRAPVYGTAPGPYYFKSFYFPPQGFKSGSAVWYGLGSGERNELLYMSDPATTADNNRFYIIGDADIHETAAIPQALILESNLLDVSTNNTCANITAYKGYFFTGNEGEKWVTNGTMLGDYLFVGSYIPVPSLDPCEIGGEAFLYRFKASCGEPLLDGTPASAVDPRAIDLGVGFPTDPRISVSPSGDADAIVTKQGGQIIMSGAGQVQGGGGYWREVKN
jgi:type IV pilus assembly protein PilY1